jgi:hypothetical protein
MQLVLSSSTYSILDSDGSLSLGMGSRAVKPGLDIFWQVSNNMERERCIWPFYSVVSLSMFPLSE